jgi:membrane fusion protein, multidrug efflux system
MNRFALSSFRRRGLVPRLLCVTVACLGLCITACQGKQDEGKKGPRPVPVTAERVVIRDTPYYLQGIGTIRAFKAVHVKPRVTGLLLEHHFKPGDYVTTGQRLFTVDPEPFKARLREVEAKLNGSQAQFQQAEVDLKRFETLHQEKTVSQEQFEQKQLEMRVKKFLFRLNEAERETAQLDLGYCSIVSPLEGQTGDILVDDGNTVTAYKDELVVIRQIRPIKLEFSLPGKFLQEIMRRQADHPLEVHAILTGSEKPEIGALHMFDNRINPKTGMIALLATFSNDEKRLWPGEFVNVKLILAVTKNAVLVPSRAVQDGPHGQFVWFVKKDHTVEPRPVTIDRRVEGMDVVSAGLEAGDSVVTDGQLGLFTGATVVITEQPGNRTEPTGPSPTNSSGKNPDTKGTRKP